MRLKHKTILSLSILAVVNFITILILREEDSPFSDTTLSAIDIAPVNLGCHWLAEGESEAAKNILKLSSRTERFPSSRPHVDTSSDERECPKLYDIAREILNGEKIRLPSETPHTRWPFHDRVDLDDLAKTKLRWNSPWEQGDSRETRRKFEHYNVSSSSIRAKKYFITYGHNCCEASKERALNKAINVAKVDYAEALDLSALSLPFQLSHSNLLRRRKGAGYWLWKPYIILKTLLTKMNDGDMLIYHDAGVYLLKDAGPLFKLCMEVKHNILSFHIPYEEGQFSKRDAFVLMGMDDPRVYQKGQTQRLATVMVLMKTCKTVQFMMEYLTYASDPRIITDEKNVMGLSNLPNFKGNRHDQTVFSLLSKKWGILELRDPCTCGRNAFDKDYKYASGPYHQLYMHDRNRE